MYKTLIGMIATAAFLASDNTFTQEIPEQLRERTTASRYYLGKEEELLIPVNIIGFVNKPGQFMVPTETDLVSLIAYAGGLRENAKLYNIRVVRSFATNGHGQPNILTVDLKKYFDTGNRKLIPRMMPDDTIIVPGSKTVTFEKILDYAFKVALIAQTYFYFRAISN
jgi:hypothetical protein